MEKKIDMYGRRDEDSKQYEDTRDTFLENEQLSWSERAGVIEGRRVIDNGAQQVVISIPLSSIRVPD